MLVRPIMWAANARSTQLLGYLFRVICISIYFYIAIDGKVGHGEGHKVVSV